KAATDGLNAQVSHEIAFIDHHRPGEAQRADITVVDDAYNRLGSDAPNDGQIHSARGLLGPADALLSARAAEHGANVGIVVLMIFLGTIGVMIVFLYGAARRRQTLRDAKHTSEMRAAERLHALIEHSSEAIVVVSADGTVAYHSPSLD